MSKWTIAILSYAISSIAFLVLSFSPFLTAYPVHSPGLDFHKYWTEDEVSNGVLDGRVSAAAVMLYTVGIPLLLLSVSVCGAQANDVRYFNNNVPDKKVKDQKNIPFRGWSPAVFLITYCWSGVIMFCLKYYTAQLRPLGLILCRDVLLKHIPDFHKQNYTGSLKQLINCRIWEPEYFLGFPSGHASMAFAGVFGCGMMFYSIDWILDGFLNALPSPCYCVHDLSSFTKRFLRCFILLLSAIGASFIAASRVMDGSHFPAQITAGSLLGIASSFCLVHSSLVRSGPFTTKKQKKDDDDDDDETTQVDMVEMMA